MMADSVLGLSDEELFERLEHYGFKAGPIVDSTRSVYQKKLINIMKYGLAASSYDSNEEESEQLSDSHQMSDNEENVRQRVHVPKMPEHRSHSPESSFDHSGSPYVVTSRPKLSSVSRQDYVHTSSFKEEPVPPLPQQANRSSSTGFSKGKLIAALVVTLVLAYIFYQNLEGSKDSNPVPMLSN